MTEQSAESYAATFDTNVLGTLLSMKHELRVMLPQRHGSIVNVSSTYVLDDQATLRPGKTDSIQAANRNSKCRLVIIFQVASLADVLPFDDAFLFPDNPLAYEGCAMLDM